MVCPLPDPNPPFQCDSPVILPPPLPCHSRLLSASPCIPSAKPPLRMELAPYRPFGCASPAARCSVQPRKIVHISRTADDLDPEGLIESGTMKNGKRGRRRLIYAPLLLISAAGSVGKLINDFGAWEAVAILAFFFVFFLVIVRDAENWISPSNPHPPRHDAQGIAPGADEIDASGAAPRTLRPPTTPSGPPVMPRLLFTQAFRSCPFRRAGA